MRAFLRRWWLVVAVLCVSAIAWIVWPTSRGTDSIQMAFDRVKPGMSRADVDRAMKGSSGSVATITLLGHDRRYVVTYYFKQSKIPVDFDREDRVADKALVRFSPTIW